MRNQYDEIKNVITHAGSRNSELNLKYSLCNFFEQHRVFGKATEMKKAIIKIHCTAGNDGSSVHETIFRILNKDAFINRFLKNEFFKEKKQVIGYIIDYIVKHLLVKHLPLNRKKSSLAEDKSYLDDLLTLTKKIKEIFKENQTPESKNEEPDEDEKVITPDEQKTDIDENEILNGCVVEINKTLRARAPSASGLVKENYRLIMTNVTTFLLAAKASDEKLKRIKTLIRSFLSENIAKTEASIEAHIEPLKNLINSNANSIEPATLKFYLRFIRNNLDNFTEKSLLEQWKEKDIQDDLQEGFENLILKINNNQISFFTLGDHDTTPQIVTHNSVIREETEEKLINFPALKLACCSTIGLSGLLVLFLILANKTNGDLSNGCKTGAGLTGFLLFVSTLMTIITNKNLINSAATDCSSAISECTDPIIDGCGNAISSCLTSLEAGGSSAVASCTSFATNCGDAISNCYSSMFTKLKVSKESDADEKIIDDGKNVADEETHLKFAKHTKEYNNYGATNETNALLTATGDYQGEANNLRPGAGLV